MFNTCLPYYLFSCLLLFQACTGSKELTLPAELVANNRSSEIKGSAQDFPNISLLGYRGYKDSIIGYQLVDKYSNLGIVFPLTRVKKHMLTGELLFGNDSVKCVVHYTYFIETHTSSGSSLLGVALEKGKHDFSKDQESVYRYATGKGTITIPGFADSIRYSFGRDSLNMFKIGKDSFVLKYVKEREKGSVYISDGFHLIKGEVVYAVMQNYALSTLSKPRIWLYSKATEPEQLAIAAYFAMRHW